MSPSGSLVKYVDARMYVRTHVKPLYDTYIHTCVHTYLGVHENGGRCSGSGPQWGGVCSQPLALLHSSMPVHSLFLGSLHIRTQPPHCLYTGCHTSLLLHSHFSHTWYHTTSLTAVSHLPSTCATHRSCFSAYSSIRILRTRSLFKFSCPLRSPWRKAIFACAR